MKPIDIKKISIYRSGEPITDEYELFTTVRETTNQFSIFKYKQFLELDSNMWVMWFFSFRIEI